MIVRFPESLQTPYGGTMMGYIWVVMPLVLTGHALASPQSLPHHHHHPPTTVPAPTDTLHSPFLELYPSVTPSMVEAVGLSQRHPHQYSRGDHTRSRSFTRQRHNHRRSWTTRDHWRVRNLSKWPAGLQALDHHSVWEGEPPGKHDRGVWPGRGRWWVTGDGMTHVVASPALTQPLPPSPTPATNASLTPPHLPHPPTTRHSIFKTGKQVSKKPSGVRPPTLPTAPLPPTPPTALPPTSPSTVPPPTPLAEDPAVLQSPQDLYNTERQPRSYHSSCGSEVSSNRTYWVSPPAGTSGITTSGGTCTIRIKKISSSICYIRLDLIKFKLMSPVDGNCMRDNLVVSGQNINAFMPNLCGNNSGQHLYIDADTVSGPVELSITTVGEGLERLWEIEISQIECSSPYRPPANCLQYYVGTQGTFSSFNYDLDAKAQYLNNLNYVICIRKEAGFCSIVYQNPSTNIRAFEIVNLNVSPTGSETSVVPAGEAGVGLIQCPDDYLIMAGTRLCGDRLNDASSNPQPTNNGPVTDSTNGPFIIQFTTDNQYTGNGFQLFFQQHPC